MRTRGKLVRVSPELLVESAEDAAAHGSDGTLAPWTVQCIPKRCKRVPTVVLQPDSWVVSAVPAELVESAGAPGPLPGAPASPR